VQPQTSPSTARHGKWRADSAIRHRARAAQTRLTGPRARSPTRTRTYARCGRPSPSGSSTQDDAARDQADLSGFAGVPPCRSLGGFASGRPSRARDGAAEGAPRRARRSDRRTREGDAGLHSKSVAMDPSRSDSRHAASASAMGATTSSTMRGVAPASSLGCPASGSRMCGATSASLRIVNRRPQGRRAVDNALASIVQESG
jgi:hypothetical protein